MALLVLRRLRQLPSVFSSVFITNGFGTAYVAAKIMGYDLMVNFRTPYLSQSIAEFWRKWHISLSSWFRDYVYIPLGGKRVSGWNWCVNVMIGGWLSIRLGLKVANKVAASPPPKASRLFS